MTTAPPNVVQMICAAFTAAYDGDGHTAANQLREIILHDTETLHCVQTAMIAWVDQTIRATGLKKGNANAFLFVLESDGEAKLFDVDKADPMMAWSGRMINARLAEDNDTWLALLKVGLESPQDNGFFWHVFKLLMMCGATSAAEDQGKHYTARRQLADHLLQHLGTSLN
jgi:hypothetical protein